jgi:hypothetical protein
MADNIALDARGYVDGADGKRSIKITGSNVVPKPYRQPPKKTMDYQSLTTIARFDLQLYNDLVTDEYKKSDEKSRYPPVPRALDLRVMRDQILIFVPQKGRGNHKSCMPNQLISELIVKNVLNGDGMNNTKRIIGAGVAISEFRADNPQNPAITMGIGGVFQTVNNGLDDIRAFDNFGLRQTSIIPGMNKQVRPAFEIENLIQKGRDYFLPEIYKINEDNMSILVHEFRRRLLSRDLNAKSATYEWGKRKIDDILGDLFPLEWITLVSATLALYLDRWFSYRDGVDPRLQPEIEEKVLLRFIKAVEKYDSKNPACRLGGYFIYKFISHPNSHEGTKFLDDFKANPDLYTSDPIIQVELAEIRMYRNMEAFMALKTCVKLMKELDSKDAVPDKDFLDEIDVLISEYQMYYDMYIQGSKMAELNLNMICSKISQATHGYWQSQIFGKALSNANKGEPLIYKL